MAKARIELQVDPEVKKQLKERADKHHLSMKDYLVLKGLDKLKEGNSDS